MVYQKKVRDVMIPLADYATVTEDATVKECIEVMRRALTGGKGDTYIRCLLVLDKEQRPRGILTLRDLIRAIEPGFADPQKLAETIQWAASKPEFGWDQFFDEKQARERTMKTVKDVMRQLKLITVEADAPLLHAAFLMVKHNIGRLPVTEGDRVVGMVRLNEVFMEITGAVTT